MGFAVILIVTIALIIFFCMDCAGKINRQAEGTGVIYLAVPMLLTIILCVCSFRWKSEIDIFDSIDEYGYFWESKFKDILAFAGMCFHTARCSLRYRLRKTCPSQRQNKGAADVRLT